MKNNIIKTSSLIMCLIVLCGLFVLTASAGESEHTPIEWAMDENVSYLYGNNKRYDRFYVNYSFYSDSRSSYYFMNRVTYDGKNCQVYGDSADPHIVSVKKGDGYSYVFADTQGQKILNDFLDRKNCIYYLESFSKNTYTVVSDSFVSSLEKLYNSNSGWLTSVSVAALGEAEILEITVHDKTETKAYQHGAVYIMDSNTYYYVCFEDLSNSYFDADGYFSYRSGTVKALRLNSTLCSDVNQAKKQMSYKTVRHIYEEDVINGKTDIHGDKIQVEYSTNYKVSSIISFFVFFFLAGNVLPIPFLVFGLILGRKVKSWYLLSVCAAIWMFAALLLMICITL